MKTTPGLLFLCLLCGGFFVRPALADCCLRDNHGNFSKDSLYQFEGHFTDDGSHEFRLGQLQGKPVVIAMFFSSCQYACPLLLGDLVRLRDSLPEELRKDTAFVLVSFDVSRDLPEALNKFREARQLDKTWHLLHGDEGSVRELAALLGVKFKQMKDGSFSHSNLITVLSRKGEISLQQAGLQAPQASLVEALVREAKR